MEILEKGFQDRQYTKVITCDNCWCQFEVSEKAFRGIIDFQKYITNYKYCVNCPKCKYETMNYRELIPQDVYNRIPRDKFTISWSGCNIKHVISDVYKKDNNYYIKCGKDEHLIKNLRFYSIIENQSENIVLTDVMKIISNGFQYKECSRVCNCKKCGTKFQANEELFHINITFIGRSITYQPIYHFIINCPACKELLQLRDGSFPTVVYVRLLKKNLARISFNGCSISHSIADINQKYEIKCKNGNHQIHNTELNESMIKVIKSNKKEKFE